MQFRLINRRVAYDHAPLFLNMVRIGTIGTKEYISSYFSKLKEPYLQRLILHFANKKEISDQVRVFSEAC